MRNSGAPETIAAKYLVYAAIAPLLLGFALGIPGAGIAGALLLLLMALGTLLIGKTAGEGLGRLISGLQGATSGASTPPKKGYSHIETMEVRGEYDRAAAAYRVEILADPGDVEARTRLAELLRKHLDDPNGAAELFREARDLTQDSKQGLGLTMRLLDLYRPHPELRGRLLVELRRLLDERPESPHAGHWLRELQELLAERREASE